MPRRHLQRPRGQPGGRDADAGDAPDGGGTSATTAQATTQPRIVHSRLILMPNDIQTGLGPHRGGVVGLVRGRGRGRRVVEELREQPPSSAKRSSRSTASRQPRTSAETIRTIAQPARKMNSVAAAAMSFPGPRVASCICAGPSPLNASSPAGGRDLLDGRLGVEVLAESGDGGVGQLAGLLHVGRLRLDFDDRQLREVGVDQHGGRQRAVLGTDRRVGLSGPRTPASAR